LPSGCAVVQVGGSEHVDTLDWPCLVADGGGPSEGNLRAAVEHVVDSEADGWLCALASLEIGLGGEGGAAQWDAGEPVDAVGRVGEIAGEQSLSCGVGVGRQEGCVAIDQIGGCGVGQAEGRWSWGGDRCRGSASSGGAAGSLAGCCRFGRGRGRGLVSTESWTLRWSERSGSNRGSSGQEDGRGLEELHLEGG